jgi:hypothetical protein
MPQANLTLRPNVEAGGVSNATDSPSEVDLFPTLYAVSVTFSYRVTLARNLTASDINLGQGVGNTISLDLLTGLLSILRAPVGARKLSGIAPNGELYSNAFVSHNIYFDIKGKNLPKP